MSFLITLALTCAVVYLVRKPLKRWPVPFYCIGIVLTLGYLYINMIGAAPVYLWKYVLVFFQRCSIGLSLFTIVMFVGALPDDSKARMVYQPLRRELSILGAIFTSGHIIAYSATFLPKIATELGLVKLNLSLSLLISCALTLFLIVLTVTSFTAVHKRMDSKVWKRVQWLAYPFYLLIYVHLLVVLFPSALIGSGTIALNLFVYTALFFAYSSLRIKKTLYDRRVEKQAMVTLASHSLLH